MLPLLCLFSGLLNFNGPHGDRPLLANAEENEDYNDDEEDNKSDEEEEKPHAEEGVVMVHCSSSIDEHIIGHLPPTLHKGNMTLRNLQKGVQRKGRVVASYLVYCHFPVKTMYLQNVNFLWANKNSRALAL